MGRLPEAVDVWAAGNYAGSTINVIVTNTRGHGGLLVFVLAVGLSLAVRGVIWLLTLYKLRSVGLSNGHPNDQCGGGFVTGTANNWFVVAGQADWYG
jgi:hypothetical protein